MIPQLKKMGYGQTTFADIWIAEEFQSVYFITTAPTY